VISTKRKIFFARSIQRVVLGIRRLFGRSATAECTRMGFHWALDLNEGIDFSIWLINSFEPTTVRSYSRLVKNGAVVLDIGANIGAHTLPLARLVGMQGRVIAFEPTDYAFSKLLKNISGNPQILPRVTCIQGMLVDTVDREVPQALYSSWPLDRQQDLHLEHQGKLMTTNGAIATTLDSAINELDLDRLDLIKLDIDGFECQMLRGAAKTLMKWRPILIMELAPYVLEEQGSSIDELLGLLHTYGYSIFSLEGATRLPQSPDSVRKLIPIGSSLNVIAKVGDSLNHAL